MRSDLVPLFICLCTVIYIICLYAVIYIICFYTVIYIIGIVFQCKLYFWYRVISPLIACVTSVVACRALTKYTEFICGLQCAAALS